MCANFLKRLFFDYEWICAYRKIDQNDFPIPANGDRRKYRVIQVPKGYWAADPFVYNYNGVTCVFFEYFDKKKEKAFLCGTTIDPFSADIFKIYEFRGHSSYPHIFEYNGDVFCLPETCAEKKMRLLKCVKWPNEWVEFKTLTDGYLSVDSTSFQENGELFVMSYVLDKLYSSHGQLYIGKINKKSLELEEFAVVYDYKEPTGRPAGSCFISNDKNIRVVQPSYRFYGEQIDFYEFSFENKVYKESKVGQFLPSQVEFDKSISIDGIHTFNRSDNYEVIDARTKYRFDLFKPIKKLLKVVGWFGYKNCDKRMKYLDE